MDNQRVLVVGELNIDLIFNQIHGFPEIGSEKVADSMELTLGSSSAILASNLQSLGVATTFCGRIGSDDFGKYILQELQKKKVDTTFVKLSEKLKTGVTIVLNYNQDRANITHCGAMADLHIQDIPWKSLNEFTHLHFSNYFLQPGMKSTIIELFKRAKEEGLTTSLDLQVDPSNNWDFDYENCLPYVDIFFPNENEILKLTNQKDVGEAITILKEFSNIIALKLGDKGARLVTKTTDHIGKPYKNKVFIDAIGAGDSFNAGFLHSFLGGQSLQECLDYANLVGSFSTTGIGGTGAFSDFNDVVFEIEKTRNNHK